MDRISTVNISPFLCNDSLPEERELVAQKVLASLSDIGFMYITGHGVAEDILLRCMDAAQCFFHRPLEEKKKYLSRDRAKRGYSPVETENFATLIGDKKPNDICEKIRFGPIVVPDSDDPYYMSKKARAHYTPNEWGDEHSTNFRDIVSNYYRSMERLTNTLLSIISIGLKLDPNVFLDKMDKHTSILSLNYYPRVAFQTDENVEDPITHSTAFKPALNQIRVAEHTDVSMLTIVCPSPTDRWGENGGLEVCDSSGQWISVPYVPGALVVNIGDCLSDWTKGALRATLHRVALPSISPHDDTQTPHDDNDTILSNEMLSSDRTALAYFASPNYDALLDLELTPLSVTSSNGENEAGTRNKKTKKEQRSGGETVLSYDQWRKQRIRKAISVLNNKEPSL